MNNRIILSAAALVFAMAADASTYSLGTLGAKPMPESGDGWGATNAAYAALAHAGPGAGAVPVTASKPGVTDYRLEDSAAGYAVERIKPQYYLADQLTPPEDVDMAATYAIYATNAAENTKFVFDQAGERVFAAAGGTLTFSWALRGGEVREDTYVVSDVTLGRPFRLFWTDAPYNSPIVTLNSDYVSLFGPDELLGLEYGTNYMSNSTGVDLPVESVVKGVYLDASSKQLHAVGGVEGQFVLAYFDSGDKTRLLSLETVEVRRPEVIQMTGVLGKKLEPYGGGYDTSGLRAFPVQTPSASDDGRGPYYYQHQGKYPYSPKSGLVFPLRPNPDEPWRIAVWWKEADPIGTLWPFEVCAYTCDWPEKMTAFVRGDIDGDLGLDVTWGEDFNVTLCDFQDPVDHAVSPDGGKSFHTVAEGRSMLKITGDDNVWFLPLRSVMRSNADFFTLAAAPWRVGDEIVMRGGTEDGTTASYSPDANGSVPGYIYQSASGGNWNHEIYYEPMDQLAAETNELAKCPSVIYPVAPTGSEDPIEVWWSTLYQEADMPSGISVPSLVQRYTVDWPVMGESPQIVIASQRGSALETMYSQGLSLKFSSTNSFAKLVNRAYFGRREGMVAFWTKAEADVATSILSLGRRADLSPFGFDVRIGPELMLWASITNHASGASVMVAAPLSSGEWRHVAVSVSLDNSMLELFLDGVRAAYAPIPDGAFESLDATLHGNWLGAEPETRDATAPGRMIDALAFLRHAYGAEQLGKYIYESVAAPKDSIVAYYGFEKGVDLAPVSGKDYRLAHELVTGRPILCYRVLAHEPGSPRKSGGIIEADSQPTVYFQNDKALPGYNPNEEHAFVRAGSGGYVAWALRSDLCEEGMRPAVLVQYEKGGARMMKYFDVVATNAEYAVFADECTVGAALPGPHPIDLLPSPWTSKTWWEGDATNTPAYRDRKLQLWARQAGTLPVHYYYPVQSGFWFPQLADGSQPATGTAVPWMARFANASADVLTGTPPAWTWTAEWPDSAPELKLAQTLTEAVNGLPEVWDASSMAIAWPDMSAAGMDGRLRLFDPTVMVKTGSSAYATPDELLAAFEIDTTDPTKVVKRGGRYYFSGLPPSVSGRFYVDPNGTGADCIRLVGELSEQAGYASILYVNVLAPQERDAIKALVSDSCAAKSTWESIIDAFATAPVIPNTASYKTTDAGQTANSLCIGYTAADHYALNSQSYTGWVVTVENDWTNTQVVAEGSPISMHVMKVVPEYYTARVVTRQDPNNLLSEQLDVVYTEGFAGSPTDYEFEWAAKVPAPGQAVPKADEVAQGGSTFSSDYMRITIGKQGDTLDSMVNKYFAMRYRAKSGAAARDVMGDVWSDWCGPALAEGWVQRVLNNVTPYTQKMRDFYENEAETVVSMIEQAGKPYEGDVALNQENLPDCGLVELYETIFSKAESMSLLQGINDAAANQQLLLAAERLADLYQILGDEAYSDALNPTIGFGSKFSNISDHMLGVDYGAASPGLFCFDNQVQSLLDEELALVRGMDRVTDAPVYNRLLWNFTRGMNAGELAYAVNYNIDGAQTGSIDVSEAATMYPQGHGDAYGHYLSAIKSFYRLLRNPSFSWEAASGEMNVGDSVTTVDYKDERRFAEIASQLARTAELAADRTARKAWRDNGGLGASGYLDEDRSRSFGYGDWATRGGYGALVNWAAANSMLPEAPEAGNYNQLRFAGETSAFAHVLPPEITATAGSAWTLELQADPAHAPDGGAWLVDWCSGADHVAIEVRDDLSLALVSYTADGQAAVTNAFVETGANALVPGERRIVAAGRAEGGALRLRVLNADGSSVFDGTAEWDGGGTLSGGSMALGELFTGFVREVRYWCAELRDDELASGQDVVDEDALNLKLYLRTVSPSRTATSIAGKAGDAKVSWELRNPEWISYAQSGANLKFSDKALGRIDRSTVSELNDLAQTMESIQRALDAADAGYNPVGLASSSVPFDITPIGVESGENTHFEQIAERAQTALKNAALVLDRAQSQANRLRQIQESSNALQDQSIDSEWDYRNKLIEIYGTPYDGDIGPSGTYDQGYDGPDLYHYMWMDLSQYGITGLGAASGGLTTTNYVHKNTYEYEENGTTEYTLTYSADGLVVKPASVTGTRRATGRIQQAYADFLVAYVDVTGALTVYERAVEELEYHAGKAEVLYGTKMGLLAYREVMVAKDVAVASYRLIRNIVKAVSHQSSKIEKSAKDTLKDAIPKVVGAGLTVVQDAQRALGTSAVNAVYDVLTAVRSVFDAGVEIDEAGIAYGEALCKAVEDAYVNAVGMKEAEYEAIDEVFEAAAAESNAADALQTAIAKMVAAEQAFSAVLAEGERVQEEREAVRKALANESSRLKYNDMFFRQVRNRALSRYESAFNLAQRYVYQTAKAYGYETAQLPQGDAGAEAFMSEIIGARSLGEMTEDFRPMLSGGYGDSGLSDIMARMLANYAVLKPRLGINNPQRDTTWFSLRGELFRIGEGASGDAAWRKELAKYWVEDLNSNQTFRRFCQPFHSQSGSGGKEPGLVIEFSTTIDFAKNFFGESLTGGDHAFDSTYFATKIAAAGVKLSGYNARLGGYTGPKPLSDTPLVYLVPVGYDRMRVPGSESGKLVEWAVTDQVMPVPFSIGSSQLDDHDWTPLLDGYTGGTDLASRIRRHPSFRAATDSDAEALNSTRLVGRSVWNTRWMIVIPAGSLNGTLDRDEVLGIFINGKDADGDGITDVSGVTDIKLGIRSYSTSGN